MKCAKCGNCVPSEMILAVNDKTHQRSIRCAKCKDDKGAPTWIKWGTDQEARCIQGAWYHKKQAENAQLNASVGKPSMYSRLLKLNMQQLTITVTNIVMKFVEGGKPVTREEVGLAVWNWLKRS